MQIRFYAHLIAHLIQIILLLNPQKVLPKRLKYLVLHLLHEHLRIIGPLLFPTGSIHCCRSQVRTVALAASADLALLAERFAHPLHYLIVEETLIFG